MLLLLRSFTFLQFEVAQERAQYTRERSVGISTANTGGIYRSNASSGASGGSSVQHSPMTGAHGGTQGTPSGAMGSNPGSGPGPASGQGIRGNLSGVSFGGYGRVSYSTPSNVSSGRSKHVLVRAEETRKPVDTLNLDEFLAEADASDLRKISTKKTGKL